MHRVRRHAYGITGTYLSKEIVYGITSLDARRATSEVLAQAPGATGIESVHWLRDIAWREDQNTGYAGNGCPQVMACLRNIAVSLPRDVDA